MTDADASRVECRDKLTVAMHTIRGTDGELIFYYRRLPGRHAVLEICVYPTGRPSAGVALEGGSAFELCSLGRAYCESARLAINPGMMPVDHPRKPLGFFEALVYASELVWFALRNRDAVAYWKVDHDRARDEAIRARAGTHEFTPSAPERTK